MAGWTGRTRGLPLGRTLWPLAIFAFLHGLHEWLELFLRSGVLNAPDGRLDWLRVGLLAFSFASLVAYGVQVLRPPQHLAALDAWVGSALLVLYGAGVLALGVVTQNEPAQWLPAADALSRYLLGMPGALLAWRSVVRQADLRRSEGRVELARTVRWMGWAFMVYAAAQAFAPRSLLFPSTFVNTETFQQWFGFPVQLVRAGTALVLALASLRATQLIERERLQEVETAHRERLAALEQVQAELTRRETLRRELLRHTVVAQEEERARVARELHDETSQSLTALDLQLAALQNSLPARPKAAAAQAAAAQRLAQEMAASLKRLVADLRPAQLDAFGLASALSALADDARDRFGLAVDFAVEGNRRRLSPQVETVLYRVAQEALTNVARHAATDHARMSLIFSTEAAQLEVSDAGRGFAPGENSKRGWGLVGMRERVEAVGGTLTLQSAPGAGAKIGVRVPDKEPHEHSVTAGG